MRNEKDYVVEPVPQQGHDPLRRLRRSTRAVNKNVNGRVLLFGSGNQVCKSVDITLFNRDWRRGMCTRKLGGIYEEWPLPEVLDVEVHRLPKIGVKIDGFLLSCDRSDV